MRTCDTVYTLINIYLKYVNIEMTENSDLNSLTLLHITITDRYLA